MLRCPWGTSRGTIPLVGAGWVSQVLILEQYQAKLVAKTKSWVSPLEYPFQSPRHEKHCNTLGRNHPVYEETAVVRNSPVCETETSNIEYSNEANKDLLCFNDIDFGASSAFAILARRNSLNLARIHRLLGGSTFIVTPRPSSFRTAQVTRSRQVTQHPKGCKRHQRKQKIV